MINLIFSEIKHFWYSFKFLPKLKQLENSISQNIYYSSLPSAWIKDKLFLQQEDKKDDKLWGMTHDLTQLKELFKSLPLKTKLKQIRNINFYIDTHTFYEDFTISSYQQKTVIENYILIFYMESILAELPKEQHKTFIDSISSKLHSGEPGLVLSKNHEEKILLKLLLDSEIKNNKINNKLTKI